MSTTRSTRVGGLHVEIHAPLSAPNKGVVVMVHGACTSSRLWARWAERLAARGLEVWCPDLRGHGQSEGREQLGKNGLDAFVQDIASVLEASGGQALVGHDMGGLVVQQIAATTPLRGMVLVNTVAPRGVSAGGSVLDIWRQVFRPRILRAILRGATWTYTKDDVAALSSGKLTADECAEVAGWLGPESGLATREFALAGIAIDERKVQCPGLVVASTFDSLTPPTRQRQVASRYRADYVEFAQHAHYPMLEPGWERPVAVIGRWLEEAARLNGDTRGSVSRLTAARRSATGTPLPGVSPIPGVATPLPAVVPPGAVVTPPPGSLPAVVPAAAAPAAPASPAAAPAPSVTDTPLPGVGLPASTTDTPIPGLGRIAVVPPAPKPDGSKPTSG